MEALVQSRSLIKRAFWLIRLRWVAIAGLLCAVYFANTFWAVELPVKKLYVLAAVLLGYNFIFFNLAHFLTFRRREVSPKVSNGIVFFQVAADLVTLTLILHLSGGIENPFFLYFVFHMILASVLLTRLQSYVVATFGVLLFGTMIWLEYNGILPHYQLTGFIDNSNYNDRLFVFGTFTVFTTALYLVVFMTTSMAEQLRRQQKRLERANAQLKEKDYLKNQYVLRLTHDIKGHLAAIEGCLDMVLHRLGGNLTEQQEDMTNRAYRRAGKCLDFVKALLRLTRMKLTGRMDKEKVSVKNLVKDSIAAVENKAKEKDVEINYKIDDSLDEIFAEPILLEETLINLLVNSVKYNLKKGKVFLKVTDKGQTILFEIIDTGIGIPQGQEDKIFEEFNRASNAREIERDGTGLGLSIAKEVIERHGGTIWAKSNSPKSGSTFTFQIPKDIKDEQKDQNG